MIALVVIDAGSVWLAFYLAHSLLAANPDVVIGPFWEFWPLPAIQSALLLGIFFTQRMYQRRRPISHLDEIYRIVTLTTLATLLTVAVVSLLLRDFTYHRMFLAYAWAMNIGLLTAGRLLHAQVQWTAQARGIGDDRVLLIGAGEVGRMILQKILQTPKLGFQVVGVIDNSGARSVFGVPVLGGIADIPWIIETHAVDEVIIGLPESSHQEIVGIISLCEREKVGIRVFPDVFQIMASEVTIGDLGGLPLLTIRDVALQGWRLTLKRGMDILLSGIGLILISPFMLFMAILIKLDSPGPVFYAQERMGLDAKPFKMLKFRSMYQDAEKEGPGWTTENDPRRTKLGAFMRRFNIDELPQLINVLIGDMSLVGPRPERPVYVEQFRQRIPRYMDRHREKAGMTGWAQVNGLRGDTSIAERTKYDLWYIENWSLALDIKIIIRTIIQTIFGDSDNAY
jgi:exopolysaccharide biosynthesis polyprenyl glycosylphosphotransferase